MSMIDKKTIMMECGREKKGGRNRHWIGSSKERERERERLEGKTFGLSHKLYQPFLFIFCVRFFHSKYNYRLDSIEWMKERERVNWSSLSQGVVWVLFGWFPFKNDVVPICLLPLGERRERNGERIYRVKD